MALEFKARHFIGQFLKLAVTLLLIPTLAHAANSGVTYQGKILKPDGSPLAGQFTQFKMQIRTPDSANCLMYEEVQSQDLRNSGGLFSLTINDGTGARTDSSGLTLDRIFANRGSFSLNPTTCNTGVGTFTPSQDDGRNLVVLFKDETMAAWEPIPPQKINFVPYAFETKQIAGFTADSLLRVVNGSGDPLIGLAPLSNAQYSALIDLANGSSTAYTKANQLGGVVLPTMSSGEVLGWNGSAWVSTTSTPGSNSITQTMLQSNSVGTTQIKNDVTINTSGTLGAAITTTRDFKIFAASPSTFSIDMTAPALTASYSLVWPMNAGSNGNVLTTDGAGNLSWLPAATSSQWTTHGANISYDSGGRVGIGTTSPSSLLATEQNINAATEISVRNTDPGANASAGLSLVSADTSFSPTVRNAAFAGTSDLGRPSGVGLFTSAGAASGGITIAARHSAGEIYFHTGGASERMRIDSSGHVGIGTTSSQSELQVETTNTSNTHRGIVSSLVSSNASPPRLELWKARGVPSAPTALQANDFIGSISGWAHDGTSYTSTATINMIAAEAQTVSTKGSHITFLNTALGSSGLGERMRISANGNVGIGTTSPSSKLDILGSVNGNDGVRTENTSSGGTATAGFSAVNNVGDSLLIGISSSGYANATYSARTARSGFVHASGTLGLISGGATRFYVGGSTTADEKMRIDSLGNVGVGTTLPTARLHLAAGTSAASTAPLKFTSGTLMTTPEDGAIEYDSASGLWFTIGSTRYLIPVNTAAGNYSNVSTISNSGGSITMTPSAGNSVVVNQSTASTSSSTGALVVSGGLGVAGAINSAGNIWTGGSITATTNAVIPQLYGSTAPAGDIKIDGTSNASVGNVLLASTGGKVGIGNATPSAYLDIWPNTIMDPTASVTGVFANLQVSNTAASATQVKGADLYASSVQGSLSTGSIIGSTSSASNGATGTTAEAVGADNVAIHNWSGTTTDMIGTRAQASNIWNGTVSNLKAVYGYAYRFQGSVSNLYGGDYLAETKGVGSTTAAAYGLRSEVKASGTTTITNGYGVYAAVTPNGGAITNRYGVYVADAGSGTNYYNIYSAGTGKNYFAGNVGIGTTLPSDTLTVRATVGATAAVELVGPSAAGPYFRGRLAHGTSASPTATQLDDGLFTISGLGYRSGGWASTDNVYIRGSASENFTSTAQGTNLKFVTTQVGTTSPSVRMTIADSGYIGIGTTSPAEVVDVIGNVKASGRFEAGSASSNGTLKLLSVAGASTYLTNYNSEFQVSTGANNGYTTFRTTDSGGTNAERLRITGAGNVGIGTTAPASLLELSNSSSPELKITVPSTSALYLGAGATKTYINSASSKPLTFQMNAAEVMRVDSSGNVGIGTTSPAATLDINGQVKLKPNSAAPVTCSSSNAGTIALTSVYLGCVCNGTSWVRLADATTACVW